MDYTLDYKKSFRDICQGYTLINCSFGKLYFKHINISDQVLLDESKEDYLKEAKNRGIPTIEESLINLKEEGYWTDVDERAIKQEEVFLHKITEQKKNTYLKSQIDILYKDKNLDTLFYLEEEFDNINSDNLSELIKIYNSILNNFSDSRIQKLVLEDFFSYYMPYCEDPIHFYGKPIINLTYNQLRLILYARYFKNILSTNDKIPENYKKDPDKLIDYVNANEKAKEKMQQKDNQATSIVGATKEDYKYINMDKGNTKNVSLAEEAKKKGGSLDMKDLMKLMGVE